MLSALAMLQAASVVVLPYPYVAHCALTQDPACVVESISAEDLAYLNLMVATYIETDTRPNDPLAPWQVFPASRKGNCDDHTISLRAALTAFGIPPRDMTIETGTVTEKDGRKVGHMVLTVRLGEKRYVLDRKTPDRIYTPDHRPYVWEPTPGQSHTSIVWKLP